MMSLRFVTPMDSNLAGSLADVGISGALLKFPSMPGRPIQYGALLFAAYLALLAGSPATANDRGIHLQGLFCNTQKQLEDTLAHVNSGLSPEAAAQLSNEQDVACNYVNLLHYVVVRPTKIGMHHGRLSVMKYEGDLIGVIVGGVLRPVSPSMRTYFITPEPLPEISIGQHL